MGKKVISLLILTFFILNYIIAQDTLNHSSDVQKNALIISLISGSAFFSGAISSISYFKNDEPCGFHFINDNKGYLQTDKLKHSYGSYIASNIGYQVLLNAGVKKKSALLLGGTMGLLILTPKEIFDGFSKDGGFSWGDMLADGAGSALFVGQELLFGKQIANYKFSFSRSKYARQANGFLGRNLLQSFFQDYNGHTFWLSINANKIFLKTKLPDWVNLAAGYSANGMFGEFENIDSFNGVDIPETRRYRQYLFSFDIDWSKIKTRSGFLRTIFKGMNYIKVPFPAFEINSLGKLKGYWIYF